MIIAKFYQKFIPKCKDSSFKNETFSSFWGRHFPLRRPLVRTGAQLALTRHQVIPNIEYGSTPLTNKQTKTKQNKTKQNKKQKQKQNQKKKKTNKQKKKKKKKPLFVGMATKIWNCFKLIQTKCIL